MSIANANSIVPRPNPHEATPASWQAFVMPNSAGKSHGSEQQEDPLLLRVDGSSNLVPAPHLLSTWSADIGWHRQLTELSDSAGPIGSTDGFDFEVPARPTTHDDETSATPSQLAELVAEIAHDIRSPIAVANQIVGAVSQQARSTGGLSSGELELLDVASMRLTEANKWAEGILVGRCLEQGTPINIRRRFYPPQWRSVVEPLLQGIASRKRVKLNWDGWDRSLPRLYLDENQLTRVVMNLVSNAIAASPMSGDVTIRAAMKNDITQRFALVIEDQGTGLDKLLMQQLNSNSLPKRNHENILGSGLGLRTSKALITALGGDLLAEHTPSGGTRVSISLPTDDSQSLLRSWLIQNLRGATPAMPSQIQLFAIRSSGLNQQFVDTQLQQSASVSDFVYRVSNDRWLWFTMLPSNATESSNLDAALRRLRDMRSGSDANRLCQAQLVYRVRGIDASAAQQQLHTRLTEVVHLLASQIGRLLAGRVPAVDDIGHHASSIVFRTADGGSTRQVRQDVPEKSFVPRMHRRAKSAAEKPGSANGPTTVQSRKSLGQDVRIDSSDHLPTPASNTPNGHGPQLETVSADAPAAAPASDGGLMPSPSRPRRKASGMQETQQESELLADTMSLQQAFAEVAAIWQTDLTTIKQVHMPLVGDRKPASPKPAT